MLYFMEEFWSLNDLDKFSLQVYKDTLTRLSIRDLEKVVIHYMEINNQVRYDLAKEVFDKMQAK